MHIIRDGRIDVVGNRYYMKNFIFGFDWHISLSGLFNILSQEYERFGVPHPNTGVIVVFEKCQYGTDNPFLLMFGDDVFQTFFQFLMWKFRIEVKVYNFYLDSIKYIREWSRKAH